MEKKEVELAKLKCNQKRVESKTKELKAELKQKGKEHAKNEKRIQGLTMHI